jgi:hypothetical protein
VKGLFERPAIVYSQTMMDCCLPLILDNVALREYITSVVLYFF